MQPSSLKRERIDWQAVRRRLEASERALEEALAPAGQRTEEVYRRRAVKLAQPERQNSSSAGLPTLVFRLGQEHYAIEMKHLAEVLPLGYYAPVPRSPKQLLGVISFRGELRAVVDLAQVLAASPEGTGDTGFVLMLRPARGGEQIGLKIDSIETLRDIQPEELLPPAPGSFVTALVSGSLVLLNVGAVLANAFSDRESSTK